MSNYQDRGLIKWIPFDALSGFGELIYQLTHKHELIETPLMLEDTLTSFEYLIQEAYHHQQMIFITYLSSKRKKETQGYIHSIDPQQHCLKLSTGETLFAHQIIHMML